MGNCRKDDSEEARVKRRQRAGVSTANSVGKEMQNFREERPSLPTRAEGQCIGCTLADHTATKTSLPVNPEALLSPGASGHGRPASLPEPSVFRRPVVTVFRSNDKSQESLHTGVKIKPATNLMFVLTTHSHVTIVSV